MNNCSINIGDQFIISFFNTFYLLTVLSGFSSDSNWKNYDYYSNTRYCKNNVATYSVHSSYEDKTDPSDASYMLASISAAIFSFLYPLIFIFHFSSLPGKVLSRKVAYSIFRSLLVHGTRIIWLYSIKTIMLYKQINTRHIHHDPLRLHEIQNFSFLIS